MNVVKAIDREVIIFESGEFSLAIICFIGGRRILFSKKSVETRAIIKYFEIS
jgi:hypothetical protein